MKLIIGLGNPGIKYLATKHNAGFYAIDYLAHHYNIDMSRNKFKGIVGEGLIEGEKVILLKPLTFMNLSGQSVIECMNFYKLKPEDIMVIYDDTAFKTGVIKMKRTGSAGGHNGIKNIIENIGTQDFPRARIGIGPKPAEYLLVDYVLSKFTDEEIESIKKVMPAFKEAVTSFITKGIETAMNQLNAI
ncbi:aminoacyl-tRNA hydrolase [Candidatus Epulonipiscioides saccharophilum]|nr:aminoacyl-tRNA hydrolase [Epulopiscium sp. SCG-B10WGA-EpuloB]